MNRRRFIQNTGQMLIAGGLVALSGYLIGRKKSDEQCTIDFACENCHKNKSCTLTKTNTNNKVQ